MKRVWLLRHAKADSDDRSVADHDRPLNKRGHRSAKEVAATVAREGISPDVVLVSTALRAQQTAEPLPLIATPQPAMYNASAQDLIDQLRGLPADAQSAMLVGHNPGMEDLAARLGDTGGMSTATLIAVDVDTDQWPTIGDAPAAPAGRWEHPGRD